QAQWTLAEARGKLAAGVQEARSSILAGREQIGLAIDQIRHASKSYELSNRRFEEGGRGATAGDVLLSIRALDQAHLNHLQAIRDHNRGQVRLMMYLGGGPAHEKKLAAPLSVPPPNGDAKNDGKGDRKLPKPEALPPER